MKTNKFCPICNKRMMENSGNTYTCPNLHYRSYDYSNPILIKELFFISDKYAIQIETRKNQPEINCSLIISEQRNNINFNLHRDMDLYCDDIIKLSPEWAKLDFNKPQLIVKKIEKLIVFL